MFSPNGRLLFLFFLFPNVLFGATPLDSLTQRIAASTDAEERTVAYADLIIWMVENGEGDPLSLVRTMRNEGVERASDLMVGKSYYLEGSVRNKTMGYAEAIAALDTALVYFRRLESTKVTAQTLNSLSYSYSQRGQSERSGETAREAVTLAEQSGDVPTLVEAYRRLAFYERNQGNIDRAVDLYEEGLDLLEKYPEPAPEVEIALLDDLAMLVFQTDPEAGIAYKERSVRLAERSGSPRTLLRAQTLLLELYRMTGRFAELIPLTRRVDSLERTLDAPKITRMTLSVLGLVYLDLGDSGMAERYYVRLLKQTESHPDPMSEVTAHQQLGIIYRERDDPSAAEDRFKLALQAAEELKLPYFLLDIHRTYAGFLLEEGRIGEVLYHLERAEANDVGFGPNVQSLVDVIWGKYHNQRGEYARARKYVDRNFNFLRENNLLSGLVPLAVVRAETYRGLGQYAEAYEAMRIAHESEQELSDQENLRQMVTDQLNLNFEQERQLLAAQRERDELVLRAETTRTRWIASAIGLLALLGFAFFWQARQNNRTIRRTNAELDRANRTKDRIFAILGHDLRKPVLSFRNIGEKVNFLIQEGDFELLKKLGTQIERNAHGLQRLTDNLLNWALQQRDVLPHEPKLLKLRPLMTEVRDLFADMAGEKGVKLQLDVAADETVRADPQTLPAILRNLVDNALKFTPAGGTVTLGAAPVEDGRTRLFVRDTGVGIAEERLPDLFLLNENKTQRGTDGERGTGLGLHLVGGLVKLHRGDLRVRSTVGQGSEFAVLLPG